MAKPFSGSIALTRTFIVPWSVQLSPNIKTKTEYFQFVVEGILGLINFGVLRIFDFKT